MSKLVKRFTRDSCVAFPAWQGMQYLATIYSGQAQLHRADNDR
ncbi:hypothetical protein ACFYZ5_39520 [Streptomyces chartreusis]